MRRLAKLGLVLVAVFLWAQWIVHMAQYHTTSYVGVVLYLALGLLIPILVIAWDWRSI